MNREALVTGFKISNVNKTLFFFLFFLKRCKTVVQPMRSFLHIAQKSLSTPTPPPPSLLVLLVWVVGNGCVVS